MEEMIRMIHLAEQGFYCSQILLLMGLEARGKNNVDLVRSVSGLAGGDRVFGRGMRRTDRGSVPAWTLCG